MLSFQHLRSGAHMLMLYSTVKLPIGLTLVLAPPAGTPNCTDSFVTTLTGGLTKIVGILTGLGIAVAIIGIIVGGLMRATSFGNERRIASSNTAITCAVVGLVIVLLGVTLGNSIPGWFGVNNTAGCQIK